VGVNVRRLEEDPVRTSLEQRRRCDIAYICFLIPGASALIGTVGGLLVSVLHLEAAYFGFFVLVPLALLSAVTLLIALVLTLMIGRRDHALIAMSIAAVCLVIFVATGLGGDFFLFSIAPVLYGLLVVVLGANWFVVRRKAFSEPDKAA
jgi:hypothetical protein